MELCSLTQKGYQNVTLILPKGEVFNKYTAWLERECQAIRTNQTFSEKDRIIQLQRFCHEHSIKFSVLNDGEVFYRV